MKTVWLRSLCGALLLWAGSGSVLQAAFLFSGSSQVSLSLVDIKDADGQPLTDLPAGFSVTHSVTWGLLWHSDSTYEANYLMAGPAVNGATVSFPLGETFTGTSSIAASLNTPGGTSITPSAANFVAWAGVSSEERLTISNSTVNDFSVTLEIDSSYSLEGAAMSERLFRNRMSLLWLLANSETGGMQSILLRSNHRESIAAADSLQTGLQILVPANAIHELSLSAELRGRVFAETPEPSTLHLALFLTAAAWVLRACRFSRRATTRASEQIAMQHGQPAPLGCRLNESDLSPGDQSHGTR